MSSTYIRTGPEIEAESYRLIDQVLADTGFADELLPIVKRIVHATGDPSIASTLLIHPDAMKAGVAALAAGKPVITDVEMLRSGITHTGGDVLCAIRDGDVCASAKSKGCTRAMAAMDKLSEQIEGAIVAVGNAPTALFRILEIAENGGPRPALVVGIPVGFVGAAESKAALAASDLCYVTNKGNRGGSSLAASAVNAIAKEWRAQDGASTGKASAAGLAESGHFYAVGVGPGAADLVTLRAARLIESADVILAPRSERSTSSLALQTVKAHIGRQEVIEHVYPMTRDNGSTRASWAEVAALVKDRCHAGQSVVQITIGDPLIYSTSSYLLEAIGSDLSAGQVHIVSGISAVQAAAALVGEVLTLQQDRMTLMPATDLDAVEKALNHCETLVLYKAGQCLGALRDLLKKHNLLDAARLVGYAEQAGRQVILHTLADLPAEPQGYMSTVIVRLGHRSW